MNHQPFEAWIFDPGELTREDRRALQAHLQECRQCRLLEQRWQAVHREMRALPLAAPAAGFSQRWQAGLAERRAREQRRQAWKIFGWLAGGAFLFLLMLAGYLIATTSPAEWLMVFIKIFASSREMFALTQLAVQSWLTTTPLALNIALWVTLTVLLCILSLAWLWIVWRANPVGVLHHENN
jgi:hypothetical protein